MPHRRRYLFVCTNRREEGHPKGSCASAGSEEVLRRLKAGLLARGLSGEVRACGSTCLDLCEIGATVLQEPEHVAYGHVTLDDVEPLLDAVATGGVLERLVVRPPSEGGG